MRGFCWWGAARPIEPVQSVPAPISYRSSLASDCQDTPRADGAFIVLVSHKSHEIPMVTTYMDGIWTASLTAVRRVMSILAASCRWRVRKCSAWFREWCRGIRRAGRRAGYGDVRGGRSAGTASAPDSPQDVVITLVS